MDNETGALHIGGYEFSAKNLFVIALILVGLFFAYVIFLKPKPQAAAPTTAADTSSQQGGGSVSSDPSALGSLQSSLQSLQAAAAAQTAGINQANSQLGGIATNADSAARDASGARTDASIALNGVNQLLNRGNTPGPAPKPGTVHGMGDSIGGPTYADYWHLANAGLGA